MAPSLPNEIILMVGKIAVEGGKWDSQNSERSETIKALRQTNRMLGEVARDAMFSLITFRAWMKCSDLHKVRKSAAFLTMNGLCHYVRTIAVESIYRHLRWQDLGDTELIPSYTQYMALRLEFELVMAGFMESCYRLQRIVLKAHRGYTSYHPLVGRLVGSRFANLKSLEVQHVNVGYLLKPDSQVSFPRFDNELPGLADLRISYRAVHVLPEDIRALEAALMSLPGLRTLALAKINHFGSYMTACADDSLREYRFRVSALSSLSNLRVLKLRYICLEGHLADILRGAYGHLRVLELKDLQVLSRDGLWSRTFEACMDLQSLKVLRIKHLQYDSDHYLDVGKCLSRALCTGFGEDFVALDRLVQHASPLGILDQSKGEEYWKSCDLSRR